MYNELIKVVFIIKRKLIIPLLLAALMFSGCSGRETSSVYVYPNEPSSNLYVYPESSNAAQSSSPQTSLTTQSSQSSAQTIPYILDPENPCTITVEDDLITVRGKRSDLLREMESGDPQMRVTKQQIGDELLFTLTPKTNDFDKKYGIFYIIDAHNYRNKVYISLSDSGVSLPDVSALVLESENAVRSPAELSADNVAKYITLDGSPAKIPQILDEVKRISDNICEGIDSDYEKFRAIVYWVAENIYYDHPAHNKGMPPECLSLEYMLNNKASVCGGYSNFTAALCAAQGIRCFNIKGAAITNDGCFMQNLKGEYHEWNIAEIDGRRVIADSGWASANSFGSDKKFYSNPVCYGYFDVSPEVFTLTHKAQSAEYRDYFALLEE